MSESEKEYIRVGLKLKTEQSQMFGKPCFKTSGKAYTSFFQECMVFKLNGDVHSESLKLKGAKLFDPSGKNRPMKEWVQVPFEHKSSWEKFAKIAKRYVDKINK